MHKTISDVCFTIVCLSAFLGYVGMAKSENTMVKCEYVAGNIITDEVIQVSAKAEPMHQVEIKPVSTRYKDIFESITQEEIDMIARLIWHEARGESDEGECAVAEVVFNRVLNESFPNTISEVIFQKNQFLPKSVLEEINASEREYENLKKVLCDDEYVTEEDVVYFATAPLNSKVYKKIGGHYFCYIN